MTLEIASFNSMDSLAYDDIIQILLVSDLELSDVPRYSKVSQLWNDIMRSNPIWSFLSEKEKIPRVLGENRHREADFKFLFPITLGARKAACLGQFIGEGPTITEEQFNFLNENDTPFAPAKKNHETWKIVVEPTSFHRNNWSYYRTDSVSLFDIFVENGNIDKKFHKDRDCDTQGLIIPYTTRNIMLLAEHPVSQKDDGTVFGPLCSATQEQCNTTLKKVNVYFMRIKVPEQLRSLTHTEQKEELRKAGCEVAPYRIRLYSDVVDILTTGTCPDCKKITGPRQASYAYTSDNVYDDLYLNHPVTIGNFTPEDGIFVRSYCIGSPIGIGAVPGFPAEDRSLECFEGEQYAIVIKNDHSNNSSAASDDDYDPMSGSDIEIEELDSRT